MDDKTSVLISIGAAVAANCVTCFRHYHAEAVRIGLEASEIDAAVALGSKVKTGANIVVMNAVAETARRAGRPVPACDEPPSSCCSREE